MIRLPGTGNFGDGTTSTAKNPSHAFIKAGSYTVSLTAGNSFGSKQGRKTVTVTSMSIVTASFTYTPASPAAGQSVQFTDTSTGSPTAWHWDFNDGAASTAQNPSHTYASSGSYTATVDGEQLFGLDIRDPGHQRAARFHTERFICL